MKKFLIFCLGILLLPLASCTVDHSSGQVTPGSDRFTLRLAVDQIGTGTQAETRATVPPAAGETDIESLYLLFYEYRSDGQGAYAALIKYTENVQMNMTISMSDAGLSNDKDYTVLALANIGGYTGGVLESSYIDQFTLMNEAQALERATFDISGVGTEETNDSKRVDPHRLPMSGKTSKSAGENEVLLNLTRSVARFDVQNTRSTQYDMVSVSIWNGAQTTPVWGTALSSGSQTFTKRYYGIKRELPASGELEDIVGGLYAFENFQSAPAQNDEVTTCLIVGLIPRAGSSVGTPGQIMYYRINVRPEGSSQNLKRNYVYKVSIRTITGEGADSEYNAWKQSSTGLEVSINNWNLDEEGMILTDGTNTMVVPVKRVNLDPQGDAREYSIFTMGTGTLSISKTQLPAGITAFLQGNLLKVNATALSQTETERRGSIELTFAGLRGTIDFIQSHEQSIYLTLNKSSISSFPSLGANANSGGAIQVTSSGPWKAVIYNMSSSGANPGFSFAGGGGIVTELTQAANGSDSFFIYTTGSNPTNETRYSFVVVSLESDEEVNRALVLAQKPLTVLKLDPQDTEITFGPLGEPRGIAGAVPGNAFTFTVDPGSDEGELNRWDAELTGTGAPYFELKKTSLGFNQKVEIIARGTDGSVPHQNLSGTILTANLRVWLTGDDLSVQGTEVNVAVRQDPVGLDYRNIGISRVPVTGVLWADAAKTQVSGNYLEYDIEINSGLQWKATVQAQGIAGHGAFLIDRNGNRVNELDQMSSTDNLRVGFDKVYYPLVGQAPTAQVRVEVVGSPGLNTIIPVSQDALVGRNLNVLDVMNDHDPWGSLTHGTNGHYLAFYANYIKRSRLYGPSGVVKTRSTVTFTGYTRTAYPYSASNAIPVASTDGTGNSQAIGYVHMGGKAEYHQDKHIESTENWRMATDAVLVWPYDQRDDKLFKDHRTILNKAGYGYMSPSAVGLRANKLNPDTGIKLIRYLVQDGPFTKGTAIDYNGFTFYNDGNSTGIDPATLKNGAVPVILHQGNGTVMLLIDPANRLVFIGESQLFHTDGNVVEAGSRYTYDDNAPNTDKDKFLANLLAYVINAAQYGSHFTDIFIDDTVDYPFPEQ